MVLTYLRWHTTKEQNLFNLLARVYAFHESFLGRFGACNECCASWKWPVAWIAASLLAFCTSLPGAKKGLAGIAAETGIAGSTAGLPEGRLQSLRFSALRELLLAPLSL
jgi:hypothetical protein